MTITSFYFLLFCSIAILSYYIMPPRYRWSILLLFSVLFYLVNSPFYTGIYLLLSVLSIYLASLWFEHYDKYKKLFFGCALIFNVSLIVVLKYLNFAIWNINSIYTLVHGGGVYNLIPGVHLVASLGISYYGFQLIGYLCDCYWGTIAPQSNIFKLMLFGCYFPQMVSGPISKYSEISECLYAGKSATYNQILLGAERILWGIFKKLVVAERLSVFVNTIYDNPHDYSGLYIWLAVFAFSLQLYADFSGCMDIVIGVSECFGISLPENFNSPFFSQTIQEFWQRWHITLGRWFRDYVMYPFMDTKFMINIEKKLKARFGKKRGRNYASYIGMLSVWIGIGIWHGGGWKYIIGQGLFMWTMIVLGKQLKPCFKKIIDLFRINTECFSWKLFCSLRTFLIFSIGLIFFRAPSLSEAIRLISLSITMQKITSFQSIVGVGLEAKDWFVCLLALLAMLIVDYLHTKGSVRQALNRQNLLFRWFVLLVLIFAILIYGKYGPGYNAAEFIYEGF